MQSFNFSTRYKTGKTNVIVDALSRGQHLLTLLETMVLGFEMIEDQYDTNPDLQTYN